MTHSAKVFWEGGGFSFFTKGTSIYFPISGAPAPPPWDFFACIFCLAVIKISYLDGFGLNKNANFDVYYLFSTDVNNPPHPSAVSISLVSFRDFHGVLFLMASSIFRQ